MPKQSPIIMSQPMVLAYLAGRKKVTRRLISKWLTVERYESLKPIQKVLLETRGWKRYGDFYAEPCRYGGAGDSLWWREAWAVGSVYDDLPPRALAGEGVQEDGVWYPFTDTAAENQVYYPRGKTRQSIFMPRWASRVTTPIVSVHAERLHDITRDSAIDEGLACLSKDNGHTFKYGIPDADGLPGNDNCGWPWDMWHVDPIEAYIRLFAQINGAEVVKQNQPVWVIKFQPS